jgi:Cysteine-rich CPXCG
VIWRVPTKASASVSIPYVIPFADSEELVGNSDLPQEILMQLGRDHRMADDSSQSVMLWVCNLLAAGEQLPWLDDEAQRQTNPDEYEEATLQNEALYVCDSCGEEIVIPLDLTEGSSQTYVEDCPVCCRTNTIHVQIDQQGNVQMAGLIS